MTFESQKVVWSLDMLAISEWESKRITSLRFLLIIFVVFIHNIDKNEAINYYHLAFEEPVAITWFKTFVMGILGGAAVPIFFVFAAYLQFAKQDDYKSLIKKRTKSLLIPYILWTLLTVLFYFIAQSIPQTASFFQNKKNIVRDWGWIEWVNIFWKHINTHPLAMQLWFVRNLIILVIFSPILKYIAKTFPFLMFIAITFFYFYGLPLEFGKSIFFYMLGWYCAEYKISFFKLSDKVGWLEYTILLISILIVYIKFPSATILIKAGIIISCLFFFKLSGLIIKNDKLFNITNFLSVYSFFLYAIHEPFLMMTLVKISVKIIPLHGAWCLVQFLVPSMICVIVGTVIGIALKKYCSPVFRLLNGSR